LAQASKCLQQALCRETIHSHQSTLHLHPVHSFHQALTMARFSFACIIAVSLPGAFANGGMFLGTSEQHRNIVVGDGDSLNLLRELEIAVGADHRAATEKRVARLEEAMRPIFTALPKDKAGRLSASGVRYMLHRLFVQRHGWFVRGLDLAGQSYNSTSPTSMIGTHVGEDAQQVFDNQLDKSGFDLHHAAVLAATLENFVHVECIQRLEVAYKLTGISPDDEQVSEADIMRAMDTYMLMYVLDKNHSSVSRRWINGAFQVIEQIYPTWNRTVEFLQEVRSTVLTGDSVDEDGAIVPAASSRTSWSSTLRVLETVGERYGRWQAQECFELKDALVKMEEKGTGRVPLDRFYASALNNVSWQFQESVTYLRSFGALDEMDPARPSVIIPNYLNGPNNCVASSKFYSSCCIDECDALISHIEEQLASPEAQPYRILEIAEALPSATVATPRQLPPFLKQRLTEIAELHGGRVPLHGRLFAQWMHHAYPRECSYPHLSGTTNPVKPQNYQKETGESVQANQEEMQEIVSQIAKTTPSSTEEELAPQWSHEEELFCGKSEDAVVVKTGASWRATFGMLLTLISMSMAVFRMLSKPELGLMSPAGKTSNHKYYV